MALWHSVRREVAGALRSARYDVERHRRARRVIHLATAETNELARGFASAPRPVRAVRPSPRPKSRRVMAGAGVGLLVAGGAAGTYLAVAGSLSALRADPPSVDPAIAVAAAPSTLAPVLPDEHLVTAAPPAAPRRAVPRHVAPDPTRPAAPPAVIVTQDPTQDPESTPTPSASPSPSPSVSEVPSPTASASRSGLSWRTRAGQSGSGH